MKQLFCIILMTILSFSTFAQESKCDTLITKHYKTGTLKITSLDTTFIMHIIDPVSISYSGQEALEVAQRSTPKRHPKRWRWHQGNWAGFSLMYNGLISGSGGFNLPKDMQWLQPQANSIGVDINFIDAVIYGYGCFGFVTGLGLEVNNYRFKDAVNVINDPITGYVTPDYTTFEDPSVGWRKTKLVTAYIQVPLLVQFNMSENTWLNFGVVGSLCYQSYFKTKSDMYGVQKRFSHTNVATWRYGFEFNFGVRMFGLKVEYYPQSVFLEGMGPDVGQFNFGLSIVF